MWNFGGQCFWPWNSHFYSLIWPKLTFLVLNVPIPKCHRQAQQARVQRTPCCRTQHEKVQCWMCVNVYCLVVGPSMRRWVLERRRHRKPHHKAHNHSVTIVLHRARVFVCVCVSLCDCVKIHSSCVRCVRPVLFIYFIIYIYYCSPSSTCVCLCERVFVWLRTNTFKLRAPCLILHPGVNCSARLAVC